MADPAKIDVQDTDDIFSCVSKFPMSDKCSHYLNEQTQKGINCYSAYLQIFNLFRNWHENILQTRHIDPERTDAFNKETARTMKTPPFSSPLKP